jgi:hypothetical protein
MLLEIPYKNGDVVSLKLTSGEEVVGRLEEEKGTSVTLSKPMMITATQQGLGLAPFMFSVSPTSKFVLNSNSVMCVTKTEKQFAAQYIENTTGLAL